MSELTVLDLIEKLFANTRGQICDKFRVNKLKRKLRIIGDITSLTEEQFVGSFGSDYAPYRRKPSTEERNGFSTGGGFRLVS